MTSNAEQVLLRFYLRTADRAPLTATHERILTTARQQHLQGATVLKGILGFGAHGIQEPSVWSLSQHLPVIVEIVDAPGRIGTFLTGLLDQQIMRGMATLERAAVLLYRDKSAPPSPGLQLSKSHQPLSTLPPLATRNDMTLTENGILLRVFIGESDRFEQQPLYEGIVRKARALGLAGATVLRGIEGFGANSVVHRASLLEMSGDLPIVIEIVDSEPNIQRLLPELQQMVGEGMITMEYVAIVLYRHAAG